MTQYYDSMADRYRSESAQLKKRYDTYSLFRVLLALTVIFTAWWAIRSGQWIYALLPLLAAGLFVGCVKKHRAIQWQRRLSANLLNINREEAAFLLRKENANYDGTRYIDSTHFYTYDLDIFGKDSLFHYLNRTTTYVGEMKLAESLSRSFSPEEALSRQEAIRELSADPERRQHITARGRMMPDSEAEYQKLVAWSENRDNEVSRAATTLSFLLPALFIGATAGYITGIWSWKWILAAFVGNLVLTGTQLAKIRGELAGFKNVADIIRHYGLILTAIEAGPFRSACLVKLQEELGGQAGPELARLSRLFLKLQGINFDLGALVLNGTLTYHIHALRALLQWKQAHAARLHRWLEVMGETDALSSYANFAWNNPGYAYPVLHARPELRFEDMGHPLINEQARVNNTIHLTPVNFMILTGSNMSGKSTFLRAIGVNMVLAGAGAPVCAVKAQAGLLPVLVSMRQSDSLSSGESYFFAEVKRLKAIMDQLEKEPCLVLLDEILRGTNSNDKQSGTIGVIKKIIAHTATGGIATHDLAVCRLAEEYPDRLENRNFEVEIINDELVFDYKLREGVCRNKSATFLMEKMGII